MPDVTADIEFLADLPLYQKEKPYLALLPPREDRDPDKQRLDNLEFEVHRGITITDIRDTKGFTIEKCGFEVVSHESQHLAFRDVADVDAYKRETEHLLRTTLGAVHVLCYDLGLRKNDPIRRKQFDINEPLLVEGPAKGAHNDITRESGPSIVGRYLPVEDQTRFLRPGYRVRIINTWRSINPVVEDRPLALCDSRSVDPRDLIAADRILPDRVGEVYYLRHNPEQRWYWMEHQSSSEPYIFVMYDTKPGDQARFCPHISFVNSRARSDAPSRHSVETRSVVISRD